MCGSVERGSFQITGTFELRRFIAAASGIRPRAGSMAAAAGVELTLELSLKPFRAAATDDAVILELLREYAPLIAAA